MPQEQVNLAPAEEETEKWKVPVYHFEDVSRRTLVISTHTDTYTALLIAYRCAALSTYAAD